MRIPLLFAALLVVGCGEKSRSEGSESVSEKQTSSNEAEKKAEMSGSPLPEKMSKEFILELWDKPHDGANVIKQLQHRKAGPWKAVMNWEGQESPITYSGASKFVDGRFDVTRTTSIVDGEESVGYDVVTYDRVMGKYRKWVLNSAGGILEHTGRLYWRNLMEWRTVRSEAHATDVISRETFRSEERLKGRVEIREVVRAGRHRNERLALGKFEVTFLPESIGSEQSSGGAD